MYRLRQTYTPALIVVLVLGIWLNGCGGGGSTPEKFEEKFATSREAFRPLSDKLLALFTVGNTGTLNTSQAEGLKVRLNTDATRLSIEFHNEAQGLVISPVELLPDPAASGGFRAENVQAFGRNDLILLARVHENGPDGTEISLMITTPATRAASRTRAVINTSADRAERRQAYKRHNAELIRQNVCNDLERFACMVQDIVDTGVSKFGRDQAALDLIMDDLVDIFVPAGYYKSSMMRLEPTLQEDVLTDPGPACGNAKGLSGFAPEFRNGEGRFRHFMANASSKRFAPGFIVNLTARFVGGDWGWKNDPTGDIAADLATNAAGRDFYDFLFGLKGDNRLGDGVTVKEWIRNKFKDPNDPNRTNVLLKLNKQVGPYAAGTEIALCRIRGCMINPIHLPNCAYEHMHAQHEEGIFIDDQGPYTDTEHTKCGYGEIVRRPSN
jgi:hypothetical protein